MNMLPSDRYLCSLLGITEDEFIEFQAAARQHLKNNPIEGPVAGETAVTLAIINLVISVGATALSFLLRPSVPEQRAPGQIRTSTITDDPVLTNQSFAPRYGFDSVQNVVKLGSTIPLVYGNREVGGTKVGGVRLNMPVIWSQMLSFGTSQMLRSVFLASEADIVSFDSDLWAVGSNLLKGYKFDSNAQTQAASRVTVYVSKDGGAIIESDRVFGRTGENDRRTNGGGSSATASTEQVFKVQLGASRTETAASSAVHTPASNTTFGVYGFIGNDLAFKVNPIVEAGCKLQLKPFSDGDVRPKCPYDNGRIAKRLKYINHFASFSGIFQENGTDIAANGNLTLSKGETVTYKLYSESEKLIKFRGGDSDSEELSKDVASRVAARQTQYDQNLVEGEVYKIGSALGVLTSRTEDVFRSEAEDITGVEQAVTATFRIVEAGSCHGYTPAHLKGRHTGSEVVLVQTDLDTVAENPVRATATTKGHILRYAQAIVTNTKACDVTEIGIDSILGGRINGLCNFTDAKTYQQADDLMCEAANKEDTEDVESTTYQSGTVTVSFTRISCFTLQYKEADPDVDDDWNDSGEVFAISGETQQSIFNFLRIEFTDAKLRLFRLQPLTGLEVRSKTTGRILMLNAVDSYQHLALPSGTWGSNSYVAFNGSIIAAADFHNSFRSKFNEGDDDLNVNYTKVRRTRSGETDDTLDYLGLPTVDTNAVSGYGSYVDDYMKLAESFIYDEISTSAASAPEHRVSYVNEIVTNQTGDYANLALVGINIRSSTEWQQFSQFSGYVKGGIKARRLSNYSGSLPFNPTAQNIFLFPDVLLDLMTNARYGMGGFIKDEMIDLAGFKEASDWCSSRSYFFNGAIAEPVNTRSYAADLAATHLLYFAEINGKFTLRPALPVSGSSFTAADIKGLFTVGNILKDSYQIQYLSPEDREPIEVSVSYREERTANDSTSDGSFPVVREALVSESGYAPLDTVSLDMSDYCTQRDHAIDAAKFIIRMRRIADHTVTFKVTHESIYNNIAPGDYIKVAMDATEYEHYNNGVVTNEGGLVSTESLSDGTYSVYAWNPSSGNDPAAATLTVSNGGTTASPVGILFTEIISSLASRTYQVERIAADQDGTFTIEALHMPVNNSGVPLVADGFDTAGNWTIS